jgi:hypothetical protein
LGLLSYGGSHDKILRVDCLYWLADLIAVNMERIWRAGSIDIATENPKCIGKTRPYGTWKVNL